MDLSRDYVLSCVNAWISHMRFARMLWQRRLQIHKLMISLFLFLSHKVRCHSMVRVLAVSFIALPSTPSQMCQVSPSCMQRSISCACSACRPENDIGCQRDKNLQLVNLSLYPYQTILHNQKDWWMKLPNVQWQWWQLWNHIQLNIFSSCNILFFFFQFLNNFSYLEFQGYYNVIDFWQWDRNHLVP